jgi:phosphoribosylaminoimidazolecarboxamide formyltransferase/IMP cyclohydrolase
MTEEISYPIKRALISVSDKQGLETLGRFLADNHVEILSTGGSAAALIKAGIPVKEVGTHTGFPEIMDGRVKTLHPLVHGGILGRRADPTHMAAMEEHGIAPIDLVVINLYPFEATVAAGADFETCIENIDIGGPAMVRSTAKNHESVTIVTDPADYETVMTEMRDNGGATTASLRKRLAAAAYAKTAAYDSAIATWFAEQNDETFPSRYSFSGTRAQIMRYGENPHQSAAFYKTGVARP